MTPETTPFDWAPLLAAIVALITAALTAWNQRRKADRAEVENVKVQLDGQLHELKDAAMAKGVLKEKTDQAERVAVGNAAVVAAGAVDTAGKEKK